MSEKPIYLAPNLKQVMAELLSKQSPLAEFVVLEPYVKEPK